MLTTVSSRRTVRIEHYAVDYEVTRAGEGWTVWELREEANSDREVAWFPAPGSPGVDDIIQLATDAIDLAGRTLLSGAAVMVDRRAGTLVEVNKEALVEFSDNDYGWVPLVRVRAA